MTVYTRQECNILVNGRDVTHTIDPDSYIKKQNAAKHSIYSDEATERRGRLYRDARAQADRLGATAHILPNGSCMVQFWDERFSAIATIQSTEQHTDNLDFDVILWGWKDGGATIIDHRVETGKTQS